MRFSSHGSGFFDVENNSDDDADYFVPPPHVAEFEFQDGIPSAATSPGVFPPNPFYDKSTWNKSKSKIKQRRENLETLTQMFPDRRYYFLFKTLMMHRDLTSTIDQLLAHPDEGLKSTAGNVVTVKKEQEEEEEIEEDLSELSEDGEAEEEEEEQPNVAKKSEEKVKNDIAEKGDKFECQKCNDKVVKVEVAALCGPKCKLCILCFIKSVQILLRSDIPIKVDKIQCFLNCGSCYSLDCLMEYLPPVLFKRLIRRSNAIVNDHPNPASEIVIAPGTSSSSPKSSADVLNEEKRRESEFGEPSKKKPKLDNAPASRCFKKSHYPSRCSDKEQKTLENLEFLLLRLANETGTEPRDQSLKRLLTQKAPKKPEASIQVKKNLGKRTFTGKTTTFVSNVVHPFPPFFTLPPPVTHHFSNFNEHYYGMNCYRNKRRYDTEQERNAKKELDSKEKEIAQTLREIKAELGKLYKSKETPVKEIFDLLEKSSLVPFLEEKLENCNFLEIGRHQFLYSSICSLLGFFFTEESLSGLLDVLPDQRNSLQQLLTYLEKPANVFIAKVGGAGVGVQLAKDFHDLSKKVTEKIKKIHEDESTNKSVKESGSNEKDMNSNEDADVIDISDEESEDSNGNNEIVDDTYTSTMTKIQYDQVTFQHNPQLHMAHVMGAAPAKKTVLRIAQELSSLAAASTLPCSLSSSIFVRSDDSQITFLKAVITGPSDTPYMGGIYEFDFVFPNNYPSVPPKVTFKTTAGGRVRFNPNLYNNGKVCLSLLGTWSGEPWKPSSSTILQVLVSLQSLVLVAEPYYNEPGYSKGLGTDRQSRNYNHDVFSNNLKYAILEQLRSPPDGFADVVKSHFYYKRERLIKEIDDYLQYLETTETKNGGKGRKGRFQSSATSSNLNTIQQLAKTVRYELMKLKKP